LFKRKRKTTGDQAIIERHGATKSGVVETEIPPVKISIMRDGGPTRPVSSQNAEVRRRFQKGHLIKYNGYERGDDVVSVFLGTSSS